MGTLSFNGNKTITTDGGGAILTNCVELACHAKHFTSTVKMPHPWEYRHEEIGDNNRIPNINATMGCAIGATIPYAFGEKRTLPAQLNSISFCFGCRIMSEPDGCQSFNWFQNLLFESEQADQQDILLKVTNEAGIMTRLVWVLMHELAKFNSSPRKDLTCALFLSKSIIEIP